MEYSIEQLAAKKMRSYYEQGNTRSVSYRKEQLHKLKSSLKKYEEEIYRALSEDLGKNPMESYLAELSMVYTEIDVAQSNLTRWMKDQKVRTPIQLMPSKSWIQREPYGTVLIISPWNYPLQLSIVPLIGSIAAGNCSILTPSGKAPRTADVLERIIEEAFDPSYACIFKGGGGKSSQKLLDKQLVDFVFFTGSPAVGKRIAGECGKKLIPYALELGGKSPALIDKSAMLEDAIRKITWGKFINAGQTCIAPDYVLVSHDKLDEVVSLFKDQLQTFYGDNIEQCSSFGRIIKSEKIEPIMEYLEDGTVLQGGTFSVEDRFVEPTLIHVTDLESKIMKQEIFGPILPILTYDSMDHAIEIIKKNPHPLALYLFTTDKKTEERVMREVSFGGGCINHCLYHQSNHHLPFGGVLTSGQGRYHGEHSFDLFSHSKSIMKASNLWDLKLKYPPYDARKLNWIKKILRK